MKAEKAIIHYSQSSSKEVSDILLVFDITDNGQFENSRPLQKEMFKKMLDTVAEFKDDDQKQNMLYGPVPENVLYLNPDPDQFKIVFYTLPKVQKMLFDNKHHKNGNYPIPGLIFDYSAKKYNLYSFKGKNKPNAKTQLFRAPFFNVSSESVCLGTVRKNKHKSKTFQEMVNHVYNMFFNSYFTHEYGGSATKSDYDKLVKGLYGKKRFPEDELIRIKKLTLNDLVWKRK